MWSAPVRSQTMLLPPVRGVARDMPRGDAARIRAYAVGLVDDARAAGETGVTVRAGDVREALQLDYRNAVIEICQVLGTRKLQGEAGVELVARRGPSQGLNSVFEFRLLGGRGIVPDAGGGLASGRGPCGPARRRRPFPAGASVCRGPGGSPGLEAGRDSAPTCRSNVTSSPDTGGLAVSTGRRSAERKTGLAVPGCGPAAAGPPPIAPEARWPGRRVEPDHLAAVGFGAPARQTGSPWWCCAPRPKRSGPATMGRGRQAAPASPRGTR